jgi:hypothetical protein
MKRSSASLMIGTRAVFLFLFLVVIFVFCSSALVSQSMMVMDCPFAGLGEFTERLSGLARGRA